MNHDEFERFVLRFGKDILRFCRMTAGNAENGDELYQDTMLKLLEKKKRLDSMQNTKSYALSTSIYLWKNKKKKYANRMRLVPIDSMDEMFAVNGTDVRIIKVGEKKGNITLEDVVVSPYQVIVRATTPGEQRELTDDRREKLLSKDPDMTDAEMFELLGWSFEPCYTICFNQDGELLYSDTEMAGRAGFAVQGKEIKTLYVFIFDNLDDWSLMEQEGMNSSAADRAVISKEIHVE